MKLLNPKPKVSIIAKHRLLLGIRGCIHERSHNGGKTISTQEFATGPGSLKAIREAAKVAHNRELSWDPFNLRIAIKPIKPN